MTFNILVTGAIAEEAMERLRGIPAHIDVLEGEVTEQVLLSKFDSVPFDAVLMRSNPPFTRAVLDTASRLRVIAKHGAGINSVDLVAAREKNILVMTAGDANSHAVAELAMAMIYALGRDLPRLTDETRNGVWNREAYHGRELSERTLGIIGLGKIGQRVAELARITGMDIVAVQRKSRNTDMSSLRFVKDVDTLLRQSDIVSLHIPLTRETSNLIDATAIDKMRDGAILINTGRGGIVDEHAVARALASGKLAGAGFDNFRNEPVKPDNPLLKAPNVFLTPHIAGLTAASRRRVGLVAADNIISVLVHNAPLADNVVA